jgi:hypothetical protein
VAEDYGSRTRRHQRCIQSAMVVVTSGSTRLSMPEGRWRVSASGNRQGGRPPKKSMDGPATRRFRSYRWLPWFLGSLVMALLMAEPQALSSIFCRLCLCLERPCDLCGALGVGPVPTFGSLIHSAEEHADIRRQPFHSALVCCADLISAAYHVQCFAPSRSIAPQRFRASLCGVGWGGQNRPVRAAAALHPHQFRKV